MILTRTLKHLPTYRYQPEVSAIYTPADIASGNVAERSIQHVDKCVRDLKEAGIWTKLSLFMPFIGANISTSIRDLFNANNAAINFVSADWSEATGLTSDGSTKYIQIGFSSLLPYNCHLAAYSRADNAQTGNRLLIGTGNGSDFYWLGALTPATSTDTRLGALAVTASRVGQRTKGFYVASRTANNQLTLYQNGAQIAASNTLATAAGPTVNVYGCAWNNNGTPTGYDNTPICFLSAGQGLTAQNATDFYSIVQTLQTNLGRAV